MVKQEDMWKWSGVSICVLAIIFSSRIQNDGYCNEYLGLISATVEHTF